MNRYISINRDISYRYIDMQNDQSMTALVLILIGPVTVHKIEFIPSFLTNSWLFSSKGAENSENGYLAFLTIITESNAFI